MYLGTHYKNILIGNLPSDKSDYWSQGGRGLMVYWQEQVSLCWMTPPRQHWSIIVWCSWELSFSSSLGEVIVVSPPTGQLRLVLVSAPLTKEVSERGLQAELSPNYIPTHFFLERTNQSQGCVTVIAVCLCTRHSLILLTKAASHKCAATFLFHLLTDST